MKTTLALSLTIASALIAASANAGKPSKPAQICGYDVTQDQLEQSYNAEPASLETVAKDMKQSNPAIADVRICASGGVDTDLKAELVAVLGLNKAGKLVNVQQFYYLNF
jgi:hypothetical protein